MILLPCWEKLQPFKYASIVHAEMWNLLKILSMLSRFSLLTLLRSFKFLLYNVRVYRVFFFTGAPLIWQKPHTYIWIRLYTPRSGVFGQIASF